MALNAAHLRTTTVACSVLTDHDPPDSRQHSCQRATTALQRHAQKSSGCSAHFGVGKAEGVDVAAAGAMLRGTRGLGRAASHNDTALETTPSSSVGSPVVDSSAAATSPEPSLPTAAGDIQDTSIFISDVASLIKLVDSRDIVEVELKHMNYEILIRKKEALPPQPQPPSAAAGYQTFPGPHVMAHTSFPQQAFFQQAQAPMAAPAAAAAAAPPSPAPSAAPPANAAPAAPPKSNLPPMLSPMAGTFYRCPAPGEPPFVKVGDRVQKGQVVGIVEAMKLMNEIEADQSGLIVETLIDDGKPVAIDTPLFTIQP